MKRMLYNDRIICADVLYHFYTLFAHSLQLVMVSEIDRPLTSNLLLVLQLPLQAVLHLSFPENVHLQLGWNQRKTISFRVEF